MEQSESKVKSPICWIFKDHYTPMIKHRAASCITTRKKCNIFRMKNNLSNCVQMQDLPKHLPLDNTLWRKMLRNYQNLMATKDVESIHCLETMNHRHPEGGFVGIQNLVLYWKWQPNHQVKPGVEIRVDFLSIDRTQSWITISSGLNRFVRDLTEKTRTLGEIENKSERHSAICRSRIGDSRTFSNWSRKTCSEGETKADYISSLFTVSDEYSSSWKKLDWYWTSRAQAERCSVFSCFE